MNKPVNIIGHHLFDRIVVKRINREIPSQYILFTAPKHIIGWYLFLRSTPALFLIRCITASIGRHFNDVAPYPNVHELKPPADHARPSKQFLDLLGCCIGHHVEIFRWPP